MTKSTQKRIVFTYSRDLDRFTAGFIVIEPTDIRYIASKAVTNDEQDMLAIAVDFDGLASGDMENHSLTLEELDIVKEFGEWGETYFAELVDKLAKA